MQGFAWTLGRVGWSKRSAAILLLLAWLAGAFEHAGAQCTYTVETFNYPPCQFTSSPTHGQGINASTGAVVGYFNPCALGPDTPFINTGGSGITPLIPPAGIEYGRALAINDNGAILIAPSFLLDGKTLHHLGTVPGGTGSSAAAVNSHNVVVGYWTASTYPFARAFRWENGIMQDLRPDLPLKGTSRAYDVSDNGSITGYVTEAGNALQRAFIWDHGNVVNLGTPFPDCFATEGRAINNLKHVCGIWYQGTPLDFHKRGFFWNGQQMIDLGTVLNLPDVLALDLNDSDTVIGYAGTGIGIIWQSGILRRIADLTADGGGILPNAINSLGQITGQRQYLGLRLTPASNHLGDMDCDGRVNIDDLFGVINSWGPCPANPYCPADFNHDNSVNASDLMIVIQNWD